MLEEENCENKLASQMYVSASEMAIEGGETLWFQSLKNLPYLYPGIVERLKENVCENILWKLAQAVQM